MGEVSGAHYPQIEVRSVNKFVLDVSPKMPTYVCSYRTHNKLCYIPYPLIQTPRAFEFKIIQFRGSADKRGWAFSMKCFGPEGMLLGG